MYRSECPSEVGGGRVLDWTTHRRDRRLLRGHLVEQRLGLADRAGSRMAFEQGREDNAVRGEAGGDHCVEGGVPAGDIARVDVRIDQIRIAAQNGHRGEERQLVPAHISNL
eukprot:SAG22_NODE_385_length_11304_cov_21.304775_8_plen_111_part_00